MNIAYKNVNLQAALEIASYKRKVIPIHGFFNGSCSCCKDCKRDGNKPGKHPASSHGCKDGSTDEQVIREWFDGKPWLNVGIPLEATEFGLDVNPRHGGDKSLAELIAKHGELPLTPRVKTPTGGEHFYFAKPESVVVKNKANVLPGLDSRSLGGYLVAPPSLHESGERYEWMVPLSTPLAPAPQWLLDIFAEGSFIPCQGQERESKADPFSNPLSCPSKSNGFKFKVKDAPIDFASHPGAGEGKRNDELCRLVGIHLDRGDSLKSIEAMALAWGERCVPPCGEAKLLATVRGLANKDALKRGVDRIREEVEPEAESEGPEQSFAIDTESVPIDEGVKLGEDAFIGIAGDIVKAIEPETEADIAGVLVIFLAAFGNVTGRKPHVCISASSHCANLFLVRLQVLFLG